MEGKAHAYGAQLADLPGETRVDVKTVSNDDGEIAAIVVGSVRVVWRCEQERKGTSEGRVYWSASHGDRVGR